MKSVKTFSLALILLVIAGNLIASGPVGIYAIVEKIVLEPNDKEPERIQIWGAFALSNGIGGSASSVRSGYLYFKKPNATGFSNERMPETVRKEWMDLKAVAGSGQAIAFGNWASVGGANDLWNAQTFPYWGGSSPASLRVRAESEKPTDPSIYSTNAGIIKLDASNHTTIIDQLKHALKPSK